MPPVTPSLGVTNCDLKGKGWSSIFTIHDAFSLLAELIAKAKTEIVLIDNYVDVGTLNILAKKQENVKAQIYTVKSTKLSPTDIMTGMKASKKWQ